MFFFFCFLPCPMKLVGKKFFTSLGVITCSGRPILMEEHKLNVFNPGRVFVCLVYIRSSGVQFCHCSVLLLDIPDACDFHLV